ncbi:hypothetical protein BH18ACT8_BH18ACT8_05750 [soil metagenome]
MRSICAAVLALEAVVLGLTTPVMISVADVDPAPALAGGLGLAALAVMAAGLLRYGWAYWLGHAVQIGAIALGFVVPVMFVLGTIFAALWIAALLIGRRVEDVKAARGASGSARAR